jgi:hypothetical protein
MIQRSFRKRYEQMDWPQQLGNLASTLARLSSRCSNPEYDPVIASLLREAALLIEWSAPHTQSALHPDLAAMQREILTWRKSWPLEQARAILALRARQMSEALLRMAGLGVPSSQSTRTAGEQ